MKTEIDQKFLFNVLEQYGDVMFDMPGFIEDANGDRQSGTIEVFVFRFEFPKEDTFVISVKKNGNPYDACILENATNATFFDETKEYLKSWSDEWVEAFKRENILE